MNANINITTYVRAGSDLVPYADFTGRFPNEDYIEGAVELTVGYKPILSTEQVDLVDQLWAYLVNGLEDLAAGRAFSTYYPDMPVQVRLTPRDTRVELAVEGGKINRRAEVPADQLRTALLAAGRSFFEWLPSAAPGRASACERYVQRIAALSGKRG